MPLAHPEIADRERLIFALDVADADSARQWITRLGDSVQHYKIGLELLTCGAYFELLAELKSAGKRVFADLKLHDIPATVSSAVKGMARHAPDFLTVHAYGAALRMAAPHKGQTRLLAITVLTSMSDADLVESGVAAALADVVVQRARAALAAGADGLVCSGLEAARLRQELGQDALLICPGIRTEPGGDDQQRTVDVRQAFLNGADYIVVGRPIRQAPDPVASAAAIQQQIALALAQIKANG